ncbi:hypothetical protein DEO23_01795 [Brachybacterium endophyticum]|uniref:Excalibur calcium-binding domain-containing protein n=2 Tax=Brachybacterium endophyticum TaxID=2182385 RepID=A0A2U2RPW3_9MICO|nr:hypothetical protein DEO23_01795 [Brachybacterium endophyticum]
MGAIVSPTTTPTDPPVAAEQAADHSDATPSEEPSASPSPTKTPTTKAAPTSSPAPEKASKKPAATAEKKAATKPAPSKTAKPKPGTSTAIGVLATLEVKGRAPKTGYDRDLFGWREDVDHNGCDTRNDVLRRDLHDVVLKRGTDGCVVAAGTLEPSPYSGDDVAFDQQEDNSLDIDHVVALSDAWQTGASSWDEDTRHEFANDPLNLLAVEDNLNQQKGDGDAATWLPPKRSYRCEYVSRQIAVKAKYDLWVKKAEKDAMKDVLADCDDYAAFSGAVATPDRWEGDNAREAAAAKPKPKPKPTATHAPSRATSSSSGSSSGSHSGSSGSSSSSSSGGSGSSGSSGSSGGGSVYYQNCDAVRAAGKDPIHAGDPGYSRKLDHDGDGVGCE